MHKIVPITKLHLAKNHPGIDGRARRGGRSGVGPHSGETVVIEAEGGYEVVFGALRMQQAKDAGQKSVKVFIYKTLDEQSKQELLLLENYCSASKSPLDIGAMFVAYRNRFGLTQQMFSERVDIAPGTIHHYESLVSSLTPRLGKMVKQGKLRFKEARCIADLKPAERQLEIADPFLKGELSSVHVEKVVGIAKKNPDRPVQSIVKEVLAAAAHLAPVSDTALEIGGEAVPKPLEHRVLGIAGELAEMVYSPPLEIQRLRLISSLRVLDSRLKVALEFLNNPKTSSPLNPRAASFVPAPSKR